MKQRNEGVDLTKKQESFLLAHFFLLVIGKPGSGKSNLVRELLTSKAYYAGKFDKVLILSPSAQKLGIPVHKEDVQIEYNLGWIHQQIGKVNQKQVKRFQDCLRSTEHDKLPFLPQSIITNTLGSDAYKDKEHSKLPPEYVMFNKNARFFSAEMLSIMTHGMKALSVLPQLQNIDSQIVTKGRKQKKRVEKEIAKVATMSTGYGSVDDIERQLVSKLTTKQQKSTSYNMLIILDDVIGDIKANENNQSQTQLFFNRRHLIANGTISLIVVSQKYTMVPARIRSNANWMILFRLNPIDFDTVYKDVIMTTSTAWEELLKKVFGFEQEDAATVTEARSQKKYDNLGIWVEYDMFFKNLKPIKI